MLQLGLGAGVGPANVAADDVCNSFETLHQAAFEMCQDVETRNAVLGFLRQVAGCLDGAARPKHRAQKTGQQYSFGCLIEALLASRLVKNAKDLPEIFVRSVQYVFGSDIAQHLQKQLADKNIRVPSESTLSRARLRLDVLSMLTRRDSFQASKTSFFVTLSTDSSPQGGLDYLMTLEDRVSRAAAGELILAGGDGDEVLRWASMEGGGVTTTQLPLALVGSGNSALPAKYEGLFHQATPCT